MLSRSYNLFKVSIKHLFIENHPWILINRVKFYAIVDQTTLRKISPNQIDEVDLSGDNEIDWRAEMQKLRNDESRSVLEPSDQLEHDSIVTDLKPTFNLAAYVNKSQTIQQLVKLGVDLNKIEKRKGLAQFVLKLDFEQHIRDHLVLLHDIGVPSDGFAAFITKNPMIFKEDLDNLKTRINYLESKNFKRAEISRIVEVNPFWLMFSTSRIDRRLGFFQKTFNLSGNEVRSLVVHQPRLITYNLEHVRESIFTIKEEMGFDADELRKLLLVKPRIFMMNKDNLLKRFEFAHIEMKLSHSQILQDPEILHSREFRIKQRHGFLKFLGKAQYDATKDLYISPKTLVENDDTSFVLDVAKSNMEIYNTFLKTL